MKKCKVILTTIIIALILSFNKDVYAASGYLSVSSGNVYVGDSFTVSAVISGSAAWNVHVTASGPVSGCNINQADASGDGHDTSKTFTATCTATSTGTISISISGDVTSESDGNAVYLSGTRTVNVTQKPAPSPTPTPTPTPTPSPTPSQDDKDKKSSNNNIKEISVDGYKLTKVDDNNYTLSVPNDVTKIKVKATAEDSKAKVTGTGEHNLNVGENNIEIKITAENNTERKIIIKVTRKDGYYIDDLDSILNDSKSDEIDITIKQDTELTKSDLEKISNSQKTLKLNYYDEDKKLKYSWIIDGKELKYTDNLLTTVTNDTENKKDILRLSNYADGIYVNLKQTNNLPKGVKLKVYVGNKYEDNDLLKVYAYNKSGDELKLISKDLKVKDGYIEFRITDSNEYFITMSKINEPTEVTPTSNNNIIIIAMIILYILLVTAIIIVIIKNKKDKETKNTLQ